jgi:hypothetical protein
MSSPLFHELIECGSHFCIRTRIAMRQGMTTIPNFLVLNSERIKIKYPDIVRVKKQGLLNINGKFRKKVLRNDLNI